MNGVQTRFKCKLDVKRCKRFVFPPSSLLPRSNALKTKAIRYFQTDRTLTRIVSPPLFDKTKKAALWVAYPIHNAYLKGSGERTDRWAFDPIIPQSYQADCTLRSYGGSYDRGHQLPSADRLGTDEMNAQTFYMSNMTPQLNRLNQDMWAKLETKVRANNCSDTLYVVTGAYFGAGATTTTDGARNTVPVPTNYFKVLLRTKSGKTGKNIKDCSDSELISIGFWVDHKSYGNIEPPKSICTSVADIEKMTGFTFFPQVSNSVKQQNNPTQWGIN